MRNLSSWGLSTFKIYFIWERKKSPVPLASNKCTFTTGETGLINKLLILAEPAKRATKDFLIKQTLFVLLSPAKLLTKTNDRQRHEFIFIQYLKLKPSQTNSSHGWIGLGIQPLDVMGEGGGG